VHNDKIYLKRSKAFMFVLIGLVVIRIAAKLVLGATLDIGEISGMFFVLAFSMIVPWRIAMYVQYRKIKGEYFGNEKIAKV
jgi:membrane protein CcdC involved in cytochrome C biogenesis